jgi:hypothetical protein
MKYFPLGVDGIVSIPCDSSEINVTAEIRGLVNPGSSVVFEATRNGLDFLPFAMRENGNEIASNWSVTGNPIEGLRRFTASATGLRSVRVRCVTLIQADNLRVALEQVPILPGEGSIPKPPADFYLDHRFLEEYHPN